MYDFIKKNLQNLLQRLQFRQYIAISLMIIYNKIHWGIHEKI